MRAHAEPLGCVKFLLLSSAGGAELKSLVGRELTAACHQVGQVALLRTERASEPWQLSLAIVEARDH